MAVEHMELGVEEEDLVLAALQSTPILRTLRPAAAAEVVASDLPKS
jgi:hypothetical protein